VRFWKPQLAWASAVGAVAALVVTLAVLRGVDVLVMVLILTALVGMYAARRYARAELIYGRMPERPSPPQSPGPEPDETGDAAVPARWTEPTDDTASPARTSEPVGRRVARGQGVRYQPGHANDDAAGERLPGRTHAQKPAGSGVIR
jgi:hypothetical protein